MKFNSSWIEASTRQNRGSKRTNHRVNGAEIVRSHLRTLDSRRVPGHSLVRPLVRSHRSLIRMLRTARLAHALRCAHSCAHYFTYSAPELMGNGFISIDRMRRYHAVSTHSATPARAPLRRRERSKANLSNPMF